MIQIHDDISALAERYDGFILDLWGVLHDGTRAYPGVPEALTRVTSCGGEFKMLETSFFLSRQTLIAAKKPGMPIWREKLFAWMLRNSESAMEYFRLPTNRVVELGSQVAI